jgi:uncharacterized protein (TIGR02466 family)
MNVETPFFIPPIYSSSITDVEIVQREIDSVLDSIEFDYLPHWGKTHKMSNTPRSDTFEVMGLRSLSAEIDFHVREYCHITNIQYRRYRTVGWFTLMQENDYAHTHLHGDADIAGVYYYKTNGKDGDLFFEHPLLNVLLSNPIYSGMINQRHYHSPAVGKILMFPGFLPHGITRNTTDADRISISFNIHFER